MVQLQTPSLPSLFSFKRQRDARVPIFLHKGSDIVARGDEVNSDPENDAELKSKTKLVKSRSESGLRCIKSARAAARCHAASAVGGKVAQLVTEFCLNNPPCRVVPNKVDLDEFWSRCSALRPTTMSTAAHAGFEHGFARALVEQLESGASTHEWKPQLRALCTLTYLHREGDMQRRIAVDVTLQAQSILRHLASEVSACKEEARRVILLSQFAAALPDGQDIRVDEEGGVFFISKAQQNEELEPAPSSFPSARGAAADEKILAQSPRPSARGAADEKISGIAEEPPPPVSATTARTASTEDTASHVQAVEHDVNKLDDLALSTLEIAVEQAAHKPSDHNSEAFDDIDSALEVAVEQVGLPGALGLSARRNGDAGAHAGTELSRAPRIQAKKVAFIPWGIELTLPQVHDPFAELAQSSTI